MAVMAEKPQIDAMSLETQSHLTPPMEKHSLNVDLNGLNHDSNLAATQEVITNGNHASDRVDTKSDALDPPTSEITPASTAPHSASDSAPVSAQTVDGPSTEIQILPTDPAENTTDAPPSVDQPTSSVRDEMTDPPAVEAHTSRTDMPVDQEMTDVSADIVASNTSIVDESKMDDVVASSEATVADAHATAGSQSGTENLKIEEQPVDDKMDLATSQEADGATTGQVRPREEDNEGEPAAKRTRLEDETAAVIDTKPDTAVLPVDSTLSAVNSSAAGNGISPGATPAIPVDAAAVSSAPAVIAEPTLHTAPHFDDQPITPAQTKFILDRIRQAKKIKSAKNFALPVDYAGLGLPSYPTIVKTPMDLSTMEDKLKMGKYGTANDAAADMDLIVYNTNLFNTPTHPVSVEGANLRAYFFKTLQTLPKGDAAITKKKQSTPVMPKPAPARRESRQLATPIAKSPPAPKPVEKQEPFALNTDGMPTIRRDSSAANNDRPKREIHPPKNRDLPYSVRPKKKKTMTEFKFCDFVLQELLKKRYAHLAWPFLHPVDPVALNIPTYFNIIKKPTDLSTIKTKLDNGEFNTAKEFRTEVKQMFANCFKFNPAEDNIHQLGKQLEVVFEELWATKEEWIANNTRSEVASADEEEEEEDEVVSEDEVNPQVQRMLEIQQQINALTAEAMQLSSATIPVARTKAGSPKQGSKKSKKSSTGAPKTKRTSNAGGTGLTHTKTAKPKKTKPKKLSLEQKRFVSEGIAQLDEKQMRTAVTIIRSGVPALRDVQDDELELDIDEIPDDVVAQLYQFVRKITPQSLARDSEQAGDNEDDDYDEDDESYGRAAGKGAGGGRKKNKPMSAREQESKIAQVQAQLQQFRPGGSGSEDAEAHHHDDSSDDEQSESSEEE